jgi:hypothetical protein
MCVLQASIRLEVERQQLHHGRPEWNSASVASKVRFSNFRFITVET